MENLRQINEESHEPIKGDNVNLNGRQGILLDNNFLQILWLDNNQIEDWSGGWSAFINLGGYILII